MTETVLLVGGGGREHAIARALADDCSLVACAGNRNPGIASLADEFVVCDETDPDAVVDAATDAGATLAVVGPEAPLAAGVADALDEAGVFAFGPHADAARIETDKAFQRQFMAEHGVPGCPEYRVFDDADAAADHLLDVDVDLAVKPVGLTGGKGVRVTGDQLTNAEAAAYVRDSEWDDWVLEERLVGEEFTVQALVADGEVRATPAVQDHKRAFEGDEGPNTGGMGSYSAAERTLPFMTDADYEAAVDTIEQTVAALGDYTGVLYGQFMLTAEGPKVVEFNARFGDPEAMNTLPVMETPLLDVLVAAREGDSLPDLEFAPQATVCKYAVPAGYPTDPEGGAPVTVDEETTRAVTERHAGEGERGAPRALLYYASVDERDGQVYTTTSRSFALVGVADTIADADSLAEEALDGVDEGLRVRHDIGTEALVRRRVEHMAALRGDG